MPNASQSHAEAADLRFRPRRRVYLIDRVAEGVITLGGMGVIAAVLGIIAYLLWVVVPLMKPGNVEGAGTPIRLQPAVAVQRGENIPPIVISGGISQTGNINPAYYQEFYKDISTTTIDKYVPDPMNPGMFTQMGTIGDVIVDAPFYDPQGTLNLNSGRGGNLIPFQFDEDITTDFVSLEWLEFRTNLASGDIDNLRVSLISPDGTQTELNPFRENAGEFGNAITQDPLTQQGKQRPFQEVLPGGSEDGQTGSVTLDNALAPGETWTWTTNRHWGELLSTDANSFTGISANDTWYLSLENWSANEVTR